MRSKLSSVQGHKIRKVFQSFLRNRAKGIKSLRVSDLNANPFLVRLVAKQMDFSDVQSIVRWLVAQRLERGTVTAFGIALQAAAKVFSEGTGVEGADILKKKKGHRYHIQVKSGPNTIPKDLRVRITQLLKSAQRRNRGSVALFGMCYGNREQVSGIVKQYVQAQGGVDWVTGKEFWEFISDIPDCHREIYRIAAEVGDEFRDESGRTLRELIEKKISDLSKEFLEAYGSGGDEMWWRLLDRNT